MAVLLAFDDAACAETIGLDREGRERYVVVVRKTWRWSSGGVLSQVGPESVVVDDIYDGDPGASSLVLESELVPIKPEVDVILAGEIVLPRPVQQVTVRLVVGDRVNKAVRVFGDRLWDRTLTGSVAPDSPRSFDRMPISWTRSFGGTDPESPAVYEPRNPVGRGMARTSKTLEGTPVPNFESPSSLITSSKSRPEPVGFGPVGRSWMPRIRRAGTYDAAWLEDGFPLLPADFDDRFFNCAPEDQRLPSYQAGEMVRLHEMTTERDTAFALPPFEVPITIMERGGRTTEAMAVPDTVLIQPAERRVSVTGRYTHYPQPNALAITDVFVGDPPKGWLRARATRKRYLGRDPRVGR
jgi:hypothetical protein